MRTAESQVNSDTALSKIAYLSRKNPRQAFHSLMHHINVESLSGCYNRLEGKKAVEADGVNKESYGENLHENLEELIERMKRMAYRPGSIRQVWIPKEGKPGEKRPLGISNFEDKLVQKRMQELLESIYDPIFLPCSYGFRPGKGCHDAIQALQQYLFRNEVEIVIDIDLSNFFGTIDRKTLQEMLREKIKDTKFLRYISRMLKAGVLSEGELQMSEEGVVQGSCVSPILSNIYAHYVIDEWIEGTIKPASEGAVEMYRYADDLVICCSRRKDAIEIKEKLARRLSEYKLKLNEDKTKLVEFSKRQQVQGRKQGAFDFLGFTFYLGLSRNKVVIPKVKTSGSRIRAKLKKVKEWIKVRRNAQPLSDLWKQYCAKLRGHNQYYGVSFNEEAIGKFRWETLKLMFKWLNRRSQKRSFNWEEFEKLLKLHPLPAAKICHSLF